MLPPLLPLAQTAAPALDPTNPTVFLGLLIVGLLTLVTLADKVDGFIQRRRRTPPLDKELANFATKDDVKNFATKSDVNGVDTRLSSEIGDMRRHISASHTKIYERIESEAKETQDKIDELSKTLNSEFRDLYRALGKAEGQLEEGRK